MSRNESKYSLKPVQTINRRVSIGDTMTNSMKQKINFDSECYDFDPFFKEIKDNYPKINDMVIEEDGCCKTIILKASNISSDDGMKLTDDAFVKLRDYGKNIGMGNLIDLCCVYVDIGE